MRNIGTGTITVIGGTIDGVNNGIQSTSTGKVMVSGGIIAARVYDAIAQSGGGTIDVTGGHLIGVNWAIYSINGGTVNCSTNAILEASCSENGRPIYIRQGSS